jgi:hypothetical protein
MSSPIEKGRTEAPGRIGRRGLGIAVWATLATVLVLQACGGGGGGGGGDAAVVSEALVPDGPSSCSVEAQVYTGPDIPPNSSSLPEEPIGTCVIPVSFALFDTNGNELPVTQPLYVLPPEQTFTFQLHICSGQRGLNTPPLGEVATGPPSLFLIPNVDGCPSGTVVDVPVPNTYLVRPPEEVSCETIGRVQTNMAPCG